jgi:serine/threonine-protein kinase
MEFLAGETLADRIGRGPLPVGEAVSVCGQIADALAAAHRAGIVHRDVKPGNVFLTPEGVKVLDFGIARAMRGEPVFSAPFVWPGPSEPTEPLGTAPYLAPEQLGEFSATPSVDVYALGVVLAETLTGKRDPGAPLPGDVPREVEELCVRCRAEDPGARPSAAEIVEILTGGLPREAAPAGPALSPGVPGPDTAVEPDQGSAGRRRQGAVGGAVAAGALVVAAGALAVEIFLLMGHSPERTGPGVIHPTPAAMVTEPAQDAGANGTIMALTRMRPVVDEGLAAGEIRSDVAVDLTNVITNLRNELVAGQTVDLARRLGDLRAKIFTRLREGGLTQPRADQLNALLPDTGAGSSYRQPNPPGGSSAP